MPATQSERPAIVSGGPSPVPGTLTRLFFDAVKRFDKPDALRFKRDGAWHPISHRTLAERVRRVALALRDVGIATGDRVGILSENRPEWAIADLACLTAGLTDVSLYPNLPPAQAAYILRDSGSVAIFVSNAAQAAKIASVRGDVPSLRYVFAFTDERLPGVDFTLAELEARGAALDTPEARAAYQAVADAVQPDDLATLLYTSGTTGEPKGVMLTHDNLHSNVEASARVLPFAGDDTCLSILPLSHIFERMAGHYLMLHVGASISYAESMETIAANLQEVRPTFVLCVPRIYEKFYARVLEGATSGGALKKKIFFWARGVAERWADVKLSGREPAGMLATQYGLANKLVFSKVKERMGGRVRFFVSGGAPLSPEINKFFYAAGLTILEGYGLTETSPVICVNTPSAFRIGTVGKPISSVEVTIAADGEILTRGPHVMRGYYNKPDATREAVDGDGWFHTGDIGELREGYLAITDRKKDIIVTAGGKNIAPQPIENLVVTNPFVAQAVMIGDKRRYPVMVVVPDFVQLEKWAKAQNVSAPTRAALIALPAVRKKIEDEVAASLKELARFEMPKRVGLIEREFSVDGGELTPTLKVKRRIVNEHYKELIDGLYEGDDASQTVY